MDVSNPDVVVSSLKPGKHGDVVLRIYEASGRPAPGVAIKLTPSLRSAREANLLEDDGTEVKSEGNTLRLDLTPFEIRTVRLKLGSE